jgi:hypothetical protein
VGELDDKAAAIEAKGATRVPPRCEADVADARRVRLRFSLCVCVCDCVAARKRIDDAIRWVDKEIRKLIRAIKEIAEFNKQTDPHRVTFGELFEETVNVFEALSGTLLTAKKRKVVDYRGDLLLQR